MRIPVYPNIQEGIGFVSEKWKESLHILKEQKFLKFTQGIMLHAIGILNIAKTDDKICDVGCGQLSFLNQLKSHGFKNLYGVEVDETLINSTSSGDSFSEIKIGSACKIPFEDKFFDVVTIYAVLHHIGIKDHETVISEVDRVLKANGKLLIIEPYPFAFWKIWSIICRFLGTFGSPYFRNYYKMVSSEYDLMSNFSANLGVLKCKIKEKFNKVSGKWFLGYWIFVGTKRS